MSALVLHKLSNTNIEADVCLEPGCNRKGRYTALIASHKLFDATFGSRPEVICPKHAKEWERAWRELNGEGDEETLVQAIADLGGSVVERFEAINTIRSLGFAADAVVRARDEAECEEPAEQILAVLTGTDAEPAIAA